jgi:polyphosphate kinase
MMHRNLDRRVEALVRIIAPDQIKELNNVFDLCMSDAVASWHLNRDGSWTRSYQGADGTPLMDVQDKFMKDVLAKRGARA